MAGESISYEIQHDITVIKSQRYRMNNVSRLFNLKKATRAFTLFALFIFYFSKCNNDTTKNIEM